MTIPRNQKILDFYAAGASYKRTGKEFHRGDNTIRDHVKKYAPKSMRTQSEQAALSAKINPATRAFCANDLGLVHCGPCKSCGIPLVGKTQWQQTCGLCLDYARRVA